MALFINKQNEPRNELQERIAADLAKRMKEQQHLPPDDPSQHAILRDQHHTSPLAWLWAVAIIVVVAVGLFVLLK